MANSSEGPVKLISYSVSLYVIPSRAQCERDLWKKEEECNGKFVVEFFPRASFDKDEKNIPFNFCSKLGEKSTPSPVSIAEP